MKDAEELVISPFREVVEKGKLAVQNAGGLAANAESCTEPCEGW